MWPRGRCSTARQVRALISTSARKRCATVATSWRQSSPMPEPMKTHDEIQREARRLIALGRSYRDEQRQLGHGSTVVPLPRVLARLPDSVTTSRAPGANDVLRHRWQRYIEASIEHDELVYRLQEQETVMTGSGHLV